MKRCHGFDYENVEHGFVVAFCECGWRSSPCPSIDDAADSYGDHRAAQAVITTANVVRKAVS